MARKKGGFGRFIGALTGTPYERLLKQVDKLVTEHEDDDRKLARTLNKLVNIVGEDPGGVWVGGAPEYAQIITVGQEDVFEGQMVRISLSPITSLVGLNR